MPRRPYIPVYERPYQLTLLTVPRPMPTDEPLTTEELTALSRQGLEVVSTRTSPAGIPLVRMRDMHQEDRPEDERTPGGWRMEIQ